MARTKKRDGAMAVTLAASEAASEAAYKEAKRVCAEDGDDTAKCSAAWDVYDAADAAHELVRNEPVEFDESNPPFHHLDDFFDDGGQLLREIEADPNPPKCDTCGVALFNHLGLTGTCRQKMKAEAKLDKIYKLAEERYYDWTDPDTRMPLSHSVYITILAMKASEG